MTTYILHLTVC